jgi:tRNA(Ile)-lysidine synthase
MPALTALGDGWLLRPLLDLPRAALRDYARAQQLPVVEDPMNAALRYDRAYLRGACWPALTQRWPAAATTLARAARHLAEAQALLDEHAALDLSDVARGPWLAIAPLMALSVARRRALLRYWLVRVRGLRAPATRRIAGIERELLGAAAGRQPAICWNGAELRRYAGRLYAFAPLPSLPLPLALPLPLPASAAPARVALGALGELVTTPVRGVGLGVARLGADLVVRARRGGERLQLAGHGHSRPLKDLLREARLPPWARTRVPLVYAGAQLVAVVLPGDTWIAAAAAAAPGEAGIAIEWHGAPDALAPAAPLG